LTEFQIRQIQVTENNDREDLLAYDEAMGVVSDVEIFGFKEAQKIWNRSDSWVSKRLSVKKYADPVRELLKDNLCGDLEMLLSLNQLLELSADEFGHMVRRMKDGLPVSRDEVRNKVSAVKAWNIGQADLATRRAALQKSQQAPQVKQDKKTSMVKSVENKPSAKDVAANERRRQEEVLESLHRDILSRGDNSRALFNNIKAKLDELGHDMNETEWVLWHGFLATVLPMMHALGNERSLSYFKRLQTEIKTKTKTPVPALKEIPPMPKGWSF
jgi:ParB family chromosome partitioning protein